MKNLQNTPTLIALLFFFFTAFAMSANTTPTEGPLKIENQITIDLDDTHNITHFKLLNADRELLYEVEYDEASSKITMDLEGIPAGEYYAVVTIEAGIDIYNHIEKI